IYLFDLRKGTQLRQVVPTVPIADQLYGLSVSLSGDQALVGAPQPATGNGRAYLVEVSTGIQLRVFTAAAGAADDRFGHSVALCGRVAAIGAPQGDGAVANCGTVYVYDTKDGSFVSESDGSDAAAGDAFGESIALSDGYLVAGAPAKDSETGAAYVFSLNGGAELWKLEAADAATTHRFGNAVAASGTMVLVGEHRWSLGAPNPDIGAASLFDLTSGGFVGRFLAGDFSNGDEFGTAVALCGAFALVGSPLDDDIDTDNGAAYFYRNVSSPEPFRALAKSGDSAIGIPEADYRTFGQPVMNFPGFPVFQSSLSGPGSNRNRDVGIWQDQAGTTLREIRTREDLSGVGAEYDAVTVSKILDLHGALGGATFTVSLAGSGVTSTNNRAVFTTAFPNIVFEVARTGASPAILAGAEISALLDTAASQGSTFALPSRLRLNVGGVTAASDTGVYVTNGTERFLREGETFDGSSLRQFFGRVATHGSIAKLAFPAYHVPSGETVAVQGVFTMGHTAGASDALIESQNTPQPDDPAQSFRSFLGENASGSTYTLIRATLTGTGVTGANNEGLWRNNSGIVVDLVVREGTEPDPINLPGVTISRILAYWADTERAVIHATLRGPGVTSANDGAVLLVNP
ncbi:MAG: hypothetical protein KDM63_17140, partial [Verrucomicrobiae bacterium]|nr:hypothetical protein [Verrucomicrobiae bacterium]